MFYRSSLHLLLLAGWMLATSIPSMADTAGSAVTPGKFLGAKETVMPDWFKESFLEFEDDIDEATANNKRLILYFHQDGCPYCNKLIEDNFADPVIGAKVKKDFDIVMLNMWGDRDVVQVGGQQFTEKDLAAALNVNFTPTLLFFSENKKVALRLNGYYPSAEFLHALNYVSDKQETVTSYSQYLADLNKGKNKGTLTRSKWVKETSTALDSADSAKNLAVIFSEPRCETCDLLHQKVFENQAAESLLKQFEVIQVNRWSDQAITKPDGTSTTASEWATELDLGFAPAIVLYNEDRQQVITVDAMFKTFHVLGAFDYVSSDAYRNEKSFQRYLSSRAEHIRSTGKDVDIWSY